MVLERLDSWRKHPVFANTKLRPFPGFFIGAALFSVYAVASNAMTDDFHHGEHRYENEDTARPPVLLPFLTHHIRPVFQLENLQNPPILTEDEE